MANNYKRRNMTMIPQISLVLSQVLFLTILVSTFSFILGGFFTAYERTLSPIFSEEMKSSLYE